MERTKFNEPRIQYNAQQEPILLSKPLLDTLLKEHSPGDLIALYSFYYYTAKWQKTNQIKATTPYVAQGLKWGEDKVYRIKQILTRLGLIESIRAKDKNNRIIGHYVKVNFIWSQQTISRRLNFQALEKPGSNALSYNRTNALNYDREEDSEIQATQVPLSQRPITPALFDKFWLIWPPARRVDRGKALTKWNQVCRRKNRPLWREVKRAVLAQKKTERWQNIKYIPHPTTWLNQSRWLDDPAQMKALTDFKDKKGSVNVLNKNLEAWAKDILKDRDILQNTSPEDYVKIISGLRAIRDWYEDKQKDRPIFKVVPEQGSVEFYSYCNWELVPYCDAALQRYVDWLKKQDWIKEIQPGFFSPDSKMFQRFLRQWQKDVGVNFFTGGGL